jgi:hypothetical protein
MSSSTQLSPEDAEYNSQLATTQYAAATSSQLAPTPGLASSAFLPPDFHGITLLSLPPEESFESFESLKSAVQEHAKLAGWAVVGGRGNKKKNGRDIKFLTCKHAGQLDQRGPKNEERQRDRGSKKTGCNVRLKVNERPNGSWELRWLDGRTDHNHPPFDRTSYSEHRQFTQAQESLVRSNTAAGIPASRTKAALVAGDPNIRVISRDIWNISATMGREKRDGNLPNKALLLELTSQKSKGEVLFEYVVNPTSHRIEKMFIADMR